MVRAGRASTTTADGGTVALGMVCAAAPVRAQVGGRAAACLYYGLLRKVVEDSLVDSVQRSAGMGSKGVHSLKQPPHL